MVLTSDQKKKLAFIETCLADLASLARLDAIAADVREERFVEHTLQIAIQAAMDVASHVVSDARMGEPTTQRELFELLARHVWLEIEVAERLRRMVGFRNVLVHGYAAVDPAIVRDVVEHHLGDLVDFVAAVRRRLADPA